MFACCAVFFLDRVLGCGLEDLGHEFQVWAFFSALVVLYPVQVSFGCAGLLMAAVSKLSQSIHA